MGKSWQDWPLATKIGIIFACLLVLTMIAGGVKVLLNRIKLRKHMKHAKLNTDRKGLESKESVRELGEGDLFGVRALEAGHYGGVAQSRPASPASFRSGSLAREPLPRHMPHTRGPNHPASTRLANNRSPAPFEQTLAQAVENQIGVAHSISARVSAGTYDPSLNGPSIDMSLEFPPSPTVFPIRPDSPYWQVSQKGGHGSISSISSKKPQVPPQAMTPEPQEISLPPPQLVITADKGPTLLHLRSPSIVIPTEGMLNAKSEAGSIVSGSGSVNKSHSERSDSPLSFVAPPDLDTSPPISPSQFPAVPSPNDSKTDISHILASKGQSEGFTVDFNHQLREGQDVHQAQARLSTNDWGLGKGQHSMDISESGSSIYSRNSSQRQESAEQQQQQQQATQHDIGAAVPTASWAFGPAPAGTYLNLTPPPSRPESALDAPPSRQSNAHLSLHFGTGEWNSHLSQQFGEFYDAYYRRSQSTQGRQSIQARLRESVMYQDTAETDIGAAEPQSHYRNPSQQSSYSYSGNTSLQSHSRNQSLSLAHTRNQSQSQSQPHTQSQTPQHLNLAEYTIVEVPTPAHSPLRFSHQRTGSGRVI